MKNIFKKPGAKILFIFVAMIGLTALASASGGTGAAAGTASSSVSGGLSSSGATAKTLVENVIQAFIWALAFLPVWSAWFFASKMKDYLENKEEQGQYEPKATKVFKIVAAIIVGIIGAYLLIGIMSKVFMDMTFADSWTKFVTDVWKSLAGV